MRRSRGRNLNFILAERKARRRSRLRALLSGAAALAIFVLLFLDWRARRREPDLVPDRVVVLPLENRTGNPALDTLGLVTSDWITRVLSLYAPQREVVPTTTTLAYLRSARLARFGLRDRALRLARGTRAPIVVWGTFYQVDDSLRFQVEIDDLKSSRTIGSVPEVRTATDQPMRGVDALRSAIVGAILHTESLYHPIRREVPEVHAYQSFVSGLDKFMQRRFRAAAAEFARAATRDSSQVVHYVWWADALLRARQFAAADSVTRTLAGARTTEAVSTHALRNYARLHEDRRDAYVYAAQLAVQNRANDLAQLEQTLEALALGHALEARRLFREMHPYAGVLHGRPEYYLHYAAAQHLLQRHHLELRVVRSGLMRWHRSLDVRLANCRVRAALGDQADARAALDALVARDTDTASVLTLGMALDDCAAELDAHNLPRLAARARQLSRAWHLQRPRLAPIVRDSFYESAYIALGEARALARRGDLHAALARLTEAFFQGLPYYEPGRVMLHADPAFRELRHTRGFRRLAQTSG